MLAIAAAGAAGWWSLACSVPVARAQASEPALELAWQAPAECPTQPEVMERVRAHVPALESSPQRLQAVASVTRSGSKYALVLALRGPDLVAQKELEVESCEAAADAAALLIALALDPNAAVAPAPPDAQGAGGEPGAASAAEPVDAAAAAPEPKGEAGAAEAGAAAEPPRAEAAPATPIRITQPAVSAEPVELSFTVGSALALDLAMLPQVPAWGVRPWLSLSVARLRMAAGLELWLPARSRADGLGADVEGSAVGGDLSVGFELLQSRWLLAPYGLVELLELHLSTTGVSDPGSAAATWSALGLGLHGSSRLIGELRVTLDTSVVFPLSRARWLVRTSGEDFAVLATPAATFRASVGLGYVFR